MVSQQDLDVLLIYPPINPYDKTYHKLLQDVLDNGVESENRTGTNTISVFGRQYRYDLSYGFPLITTKKMFFGGVADELLWFLSGSTNVNDLPDRTQKWWKPWAAADGTLGPIYGHQFRQWTAFGSYDGLPDNIDQIANAIEQIKTNPNSRRLIVSTWNVGDIQDMKLPPCHGNHIQFYVKNNKLSCSMLQRSGDAFIGIPVNIASYALLTHMIAQVCNLKVGEFIHNINNLHIYVNHIDQVKEQLSRSSHAPPSLKLNQDIKDIDNFKVSDIVLENYNSHPTIKAEVAI